MSRQLISRSDQTFNGRGLYSGYQSSKPGQEVHLMHRFRPTGNLAIAFTAGLTAGASSGTLTGAFTGPSALLPITFSDGEVLTGKFTNGSTAVTFFPATPPSTGGSYGPAATLVNNVTANATVGGIPPQLGVANTIALSQAITAGTPALINGASAAAGVATLDVPRNVVAAWTVTSVLTVTGTDVYGAVQTESSASGTTFTGKKAFKTITAINVSISVTGATVGTGSVLGLPFRCGSGDLFAPTLNDAADASTLVLADLTLPATATTGDVRGTIAMAGALNGAKYVGALLKVYDNSTQVGAFGVTPA